ncbi:nucleotide exchange factor GrpE [Phycicoccus sp. BSK3Z-2]|uniref:Protein GrpE n=1 Tax=Phycicoccus avicenniae TaxID=2828860 RepID=A0A941DE24_9MICO|nr:nucleotide exchange factor GrpE [Phycicoccus avicenniae]MBR7744612.1 nucleotide exchange factor GrpE [Phycicoccus avicenniae]
MTEQSRNDPERAEESVNTEAVNDDPAQPAPTADPAAATDPSVAAPGEPGTTEPGPTEAVPAEEVVVPEGEDVHPDTVLAAERLADLQRLQAEYVNYKRRVDRDRAVDQERAVRDVLGSLLGTLDDIHAARQHGDLTGPFSAIADKLETALGRYGLERFGDKGEAFDPQQHEALMHAPWPEDDDELPTGSTSTTVVTVLQPGYRANEHVLRPARVAVADPD